MNSSIMIGGCTPVDVLPGDDLAVRERDDRLVGRALAALVEHDERLARHRLAGAMHGRLGRLVQGDEDEPRRRARGPSPP